MQRRRLLVALRVGAQLLALAFVVWTGFRVARGWRGMPAAVPVQAIALAAAASLTSNFVQAVAWREQIEFASGRKLPWHVHLRVFLASNLGRYMPGKVGLPAIRIAGLVSFGLRPALVTARQFDALRRALDHAHAAREAREAGVPLDLIAVDVRASLYAIGEITGEHVSEAVLDEIFSRFCIGK